MKTSVLLAALCGSSLLSAALAFTQPLSTSVVLTQHSRVGTLLRNTLDHQEEPISTTKTTSPFTVDRRRVLFRCVTSSLTTAALLSTTLSSPAQAASDLFKPNPLTNSALEQLRIWNQDEADNIKYGGELDSGSNKPGAFEQYVDLLQPILGVQSDLVQINQLIHSNDKLSTKEDYVTMLENVNQILSHEIFEKIRFKKAFNAFADNIYYSDPDRANLYLAGGQCLNLLKHLRTCCGMMC